jgi:glycosyltransferase involved in cell wall biosynthesis
MENLSAYVLTMNSQQYLKEILRHLVEVAEDVVVVDSGSTDKTEAIAKSFPSVRFVFNTFKNFKDQRTFAAKICHYDMVLFLDSDEIPLKGFKNAIENLKMQNFPADAYTIEREWNVLGKNIHCLYPVVSPDNPIRMYRKSQVSFDDSNLVHETPSGYKTVGEINSTIKHITFHTKKELFQKLDFYTGIAAQDVIEKKKASIHKLLFSPFASLMKWYFFKGGYRDGFTGLILAWYAFAYTRQKYLKALKLQKEIGLAKNHRNTFIL